MNISEMGKQIMIPLIVSLCMGVFSVLWNAGTQKTLLEQNIQATSELSKAVVELRVQMAIANERFATKEQLADTEKRLMLVERSK